MTKKLADQALGISYPLMLLDGDGCTRFINKESDLADYISEFVAAGWEEKPENAFDDVEIYPIEVDPVTKHLKQADRIHLEIETSYTIKRT